MLALLSHGYLPCSLESDEKLLEMSRGLGTGCAGASRHRRCQTARDEGEKARNVATWFVVCLKSIDKFILDVFLVVDHDSDLKNRC